MFITFARVGYVENAQAEFSSVLKCIESDFGLENLTNRDLNTTDLTQAFDFRQRPRPAPQLQQRTCTASAGP